VGGEGAEFVDERGEGCGNLVEGGSDGGGGGAGGAVVVVAGVGAGDGIAKWHST
jgi:hypothetical protein